MNKVMTMQPVERRYLILNELSKHEKVDIDQLASQLNVSAMTIRRDLSHLEAEKKIIRTHGGAVLNKSLITETSFHIKEGKNSSQKQHIAQGAARYIQEHSTILLDSGTTTLEIAKLIKQKQGLTVITNDIKIAAELMDSAIKVIVSGGELQNNTGALFGPLTEQILNHVHVDLFFLGAHAVHSKAGVTAPTFEKALIKRHMIEAAGATWLVTDSSKFDQKSLAKVCDFSQIDGMITDQDLPEHYASLLKEQLTLVIARGGEDNEDWCYRR
ncbi:DeoR/GlpR family DNA-binding transcription regulator [Pullulanibacillus camelliae]|nr:DeoR/GlpR family DNA-binding transcription regulator [Pullulanibacillus camelliae]